MKRFLVMMMVTFTTLMANAQFYVGGSTSMWYNKSEDITQFTLSPELGYEINNKWAVGGALKFVLLSDNYSKITIAPYGRFSFCKNDYFKLFLDMGLGLSVINNDTHTKTGLQIGVKPGIAINLNDHWSIVSRVGFLGYDDIEQQGFGLLVNGNNMNFGLQYTF